MNEKKIYLIGIFLALAIGYEDYIVFFGYIALAIFTILALMLRMLKEVDISSKFVRTDFCPGTKNIILNTPLVLCLLVIISWVYGISIGVFGGAEAENIFRNFFGLLLYLLFPVYLIIKPNPFSVSRVVILAGLVQLIIAIYSFKPEVLFVFNIAELGSISDIRSSYSTSYTIIFPLLAACFGLLLFDVKQQHYKNKILVGLVFLVALFSLNIITASKGFVLATAFLSLLIGIIWLRSKKVRIQLSASVLVIVLAFFLYSTYTDFFELMILSFSLGEAGNSIREEQALALWNELSFLGAGLGSSLMSGYKRDETGYGFELTYLNLLHKLGFFSIPIFSLYLYTFIQSLSWLVRDYKNILPYICLGGCCYMIVGIGNPLLLSSATVTLHCSILYLIVKMKGKNDQRMHGNLQW